MKYTYFIDRMTHDFKKTMLELRKWKEVHATYGSVYAEDETYCIIIVQSDTVTEQELQHWLDNHKGIGEYIGIAVAKPEGQ